ncbi:MAG: hypothetical protein HKN76_05495 [Saprospiraceae bacterium]|nr:hypothetical protein [Saprospiraceae bacterium]
MTNTMLRPVLASIMLLMVLLDGRAQNIPLYIENPTPGTEAVRIMGNNTWLSFYDGILYDGFLWNNSGYIGLGTSHLNSFGRLSFYTYGQERMSITPGGNIGIGTSVPAYKLHVDASGVAIHGKSTSNYGLYGYSSGQIGIYGYSNASGSAGIFGQSAYIGVEGITNAGSTDGGRQGIRGDNHGSATGFAGYFYGNVGVTGTLTKGAGSFKIDHPLDPENKYLSHSFVESPDMKNFYDGMIITDGSGNAHVILPDWFVALNKDFRYQLTVIDQFAQAIVSEKIMTNSFSIKTNVPGVEVSWQVTATRKDAYAEQHRIPVEEYKPAKERGKYLHPDAFGQPMEKAVDFRNHQKSIEPDH